MQKKVRTAKARKASLARRSDQASAQSPPPAIYALRDWTVKKANGKWYIAPTARFEDKPQWSKPYATLQRATTAIARKLADEVMKRHKRRCAAYTGAGDRGEDDCAAVDEFVGPTARSQQLQCTADPFAVNEMPPLAK